MIVAALSIFLPYQLAWINDESLFKLGDKSRRTGWTWCEAYDAVSCRWRKRNNVNRDYWFSSADESAGAEFIEYCRFWVNELFHEVANLATEHYIDPDTNRFATAMVIKCPNGRKIVAMTSNPRRFRSKGGDVCLDEFAFHDDPRAMYDAASPVTQWGGKIRIFSTPNGEGSYYNTLVQNCRKVLAALGVADLSDRSQFPSFDVMRAKAREMKIKPVFSYHHVTIVDAVEQGIVERINEKTGSNLTREQFLQDCRDKSRSEDAFNQEYMCTPSADASAWLPYSLIESCEHEDCPKADEPLTGYTGGLCAVGVDVGREVDLTVITVMELVGDVKWMRRRIELFKTPLPVQLDILIPILMEVKLLRACIDKTGIGLGLSEFAARKFGSRIEGVQFTSASKEDMAVRMKSHFEDRGLRITENDTVLRDDLHRVRKTTTAAGNIRFEGERTGEGHADRFWSVSLALLAGDSDYVPFEFIPTRPLTFGSGLRLGNRGVW